MKKHIEVDIEDGKLTIKEDNCTGETYAISEEWPAVIYETATHLMTYLEGI